MSIASPPVAPPLAFRVGVTGSRTIAPQAESVVRAAVARVLGLLRQTIEALAAEPWAKRTHPTEANGAVAAQLRLLSPLAEGADRLVAEEGLRLGYRLEAALPFDRGEYAKDFSEHRGSAEAFGALLERAEDRVLALDGGRGEDESRSYAAVGRLVVRNSDLLIAIWDDEKPALGAGGTQDTIRFAMRAGPPVWWIDAKGRLDPAFLESGQHFRDRHQAPRGADAWTALRAYVEATIRPPAPTPAGRRSVTERTADFLQIVTHSRRDPLLAYLNEKPREPHWGWGAHGRFMRLAARRARSPDPPSPPSIEGYWLKYYSPADYLSRSYAERYRSSYVYILLLGAVALSAAALALAFRVVGWILAAKVSTGIEGLALAAIVLLYLCNLLGRWHDRWIGYRLLAELCRKQQILALLGLSLPKVEVSRAAGAAAGKNAWINWYFDAAVRGAPLPAGYLGSQRLTEIRQNVETSLIAGQKEYHAERRATSEQAAIFLRDLGDVCFGLTFVCVIGEIFLGGGLGLSVLAAVLPAASAALFGIRAYSELDVLADESTRMLVILDALEQKIETLDLDRPLASQDFGADLVHLAAEMLTDVSGWAQLFRMKVVAVG